MALFGKKKTEQKETTAAPAVKSAAAQSARSLAYVLRHARITEKATMNQAGGVYTFDVDVTATKRDIMQAIKALYNVTPRKVAVVNVRRKNIRSARTGRTGVKGGGRKAYVYLKKGESITIS